MRDVIIYLQDGFSPIFQGSHPMKASVKPSAMLMEHPVADGSVIVDHRIIKPLEIAVSMILERGEYEDAYAEIEGVFNRGDLLVVSCRSGVFENMVLTDIPSGESPEMFDTIRVDLNLKRVVFVSPQFGKLPPAQVASATDSSTVDRGQVQPRVSLLARAFN